MKRPFYYARLLAICEHADGDRPELKAPAPSWPRDDLVLALSQVSTLAIQEDLQWGLAKTMEVSSATRKLRGYWRNIAITLIDRVLSVIACRKYALYATPEKSRPEELRK